MKDNRLVILSNETGEGFAKAVSEKIDAENIPVERKRHPDNELKVRPSVSIRGADVFYICPYYPNPMERHTETLLMLDAMKYASAGRITVVPTYFGFQRSDWKDESRVPIGIRMILRTLEVAGADRILTMHLHAPQIQGMSGIPFDVLQALPIFREWYEKDIRSESYNASVVSADSGGAKYTESCAKLIGADIGMIWKRRTGGEDVDSHHFVGDVKGKTVLMPDDQTATGTSILKGAKRLKEYHGAERVYGFVTHGVFARRSEGPSEDMIMQDKYLDGLVVTDTIPRDAAWQEKYSSKIFVRSVVDNFGEAIYRIHSNESLEDLFQV